MKIQARMFLRIRPGPRDSRIPRVVQNYLLPDEHVTLVVHKHPGVFTAHGLVLGCWCIAACLVTALTDSGALVLAVLWGVFAVLAAWLAVRVAAWLESYFVATDIRLIFITGLVTKKTETVPLREIGTLKGRRSPLGRVLGYGESVAEPAKPGYAIPRMNYLPYPEQLLAEMHELLRLKDGGD